MADDVQSQTIEMYRGEDVVIPFALDGDPVDISTWAWAFTVKGGKTQYVFLTLSDGISISGSDVLVTISRTISKGLAARDYDFDLWRTDVGSNQRVAGGTLTILPEQYSYTI